VKAWGFFVAKMRKLNDLFLKIADAVSYGMGTPGNIIFWIIAVVAWIGFGPEIAKSSFLPDWFTSNAFNFPLNTVTTLAELYIGFLVAAAANRTERKNSQLSRQMKETIDQVKELNEQQDEMLKMLLEYQKKEIKEEKKIEKLIKKGK